jgi:hypothetical protein
MQHNCELSVIDLGSTPVQETIDDLDEPVKLLRKATNTQKRDSSLSISQMAQQRQQASTQEAPKRRLDVREDECANLTPKSFVLIDAILGLLTACFTK